MEFDLAIIGCGSAGVEAAKETLKLRKRVICIERSPEWIGGTCLNKGCIPTKHLREGAYLTEKLQSADFYGISTSLKGLDILSSIKSANEKVIRPIREATYKFLSSKGIKFLFSQNVVFADKNTLLVDGKPVRAKYFLIATGSSPFSVPNVVPDGEFVLDTDSFWNIEAAPRRVLIVGGGVSGVEFAYILKRYGAEEVHIVELQKSLLPSVKNLSPDVVKRLEKKLKSEGIKIHLQTVVEDINPSKKRIKLSNGLLLEGIDFVLLTVGRRPNTSDLRLEKVGVKLTPRGYIEVNRSYRSSVENIYAVGDVIETPALAHVAKAEARLAVRNIFLKTSDSLDYSKVPSVVYSAYELGSFGWGERELKERKIPYKVKMASFRSVAKALSEGEEGLIKVFVSSKGEILGANVLSKKHTDSLIHLLLLAKEEGLKIDHLKEFVFAHPTVDEVLENL